MSPVRKILLKENILILTKTVLKRFSNGMKIFLFFLLFLVFPSISIAQTTTPKQTKVPTSESLQKINDRVDELKDKVASRVAQLKLVEKRGIVGTVETVSATQISLSDLNNKRRIIDVDEFTKFSSEEDDFGISDIKKGSKISILGLYNKESQRLLARFINEVSIPIFLNGVISNKSDDDFTFTLSTEQGKDYIVDIERVTKTFFYDEGSLETSGFSKIEILENAIVIGFPDPKDERRISAGRVITFPDLPNNPKVQIGQQPLSPSPTNKPSPTKKTSPLEE